MSRRFAAIWLRYLKTDWYTRRHIPGLSATAFALAAPDHGRMVITAVNAIAEQKGIFPGTAVADARAIFPAVHVLDDKPGHAEKILNGLAGWCIRYTPAVSVDMPDGLIFDATGCAHLWGGEKEYIEDILQRLNGFGYHARIAIADTIGAAWALSRFGENAPIVPVGEQTAALLPLPPAALRLDAETLSVLQKLGLRTINSFISMPRSALRRRFGQQFVTRLDQALGQEEEIMLPVQPIEPYSERLPCLEPILTRTGIEIGLQRLLDALCDRLKQQGKGLRAASFKCFRVDGRVQTIEIGTNRATHSTKHLFKLFELKLDGIEPALGIELFLLEAGKVEELVTQQVDLWQHAGLNNTALSELLDRFMGKFGQDHIHRYLPDEHYWPERSMRLASSINEKPTTTWQVSRPRPLHLLKEPEPIVATAIVPDYPPMNFRYKGKLHIIKKADGPERIEQEWWLQQGKHRDYYYVEDEEGHRYWLFRSGHYDEERTYEWFIHGFFA